MEEEGKREKFKRELEKHKERVEKTRRLFNIDDFVADADRVREVEVPDYGITVRYKRLTNEDSLKLNKIEDAQEKNLETFFIMLSKADPNVTREKVWKMDPILTAKILTAIAANEFNFLTQKK